MASESPSTNKRKREDSVTENNSPKRTPSSSKGNLEAIRYKRGKLELLDQRKLPLEFIYDDASDAALGWEAIRDMKVRGAPAIAIAGVLSLAAELEDKRARRTFATAEEAIDHICARLEYLKTSRPTAVNLTIEADRFAARARALAATTSADEFGAETVLLDYIHAAEALIKQDIDDNKKSGAFGADHVRQLLKKDKLRALTHCNTGALATGGYGTALGVVRRLHETGHLEHAYCTETRPYNQGSRLTAFELVYEHIPSTLICDSMASALMQAGKVDCVFVGADRIVNNGDTANKIGTYQLAIAAQYHEIPFFVVAPTSTIDLTLTNGSQIPIEQRSATEVTHSLGKRVAAEGIEVWNPAFDVTPGALIAGIVTEKGVALPGEDGSYDLLAWSGGLQF